jgi:hypothetical protein
MKKYLISLAITPVLLAGCQTTSVNHLKTEGRIYFQYDQVACAEIDFGCNEGYEKFTDATGCGCQLTTIEEVETTEDPIVIEEEEDVAEEEVTEETIDEEEVVEDEVIEEETDEEIGEDEEVIEEEVVEDEVIEEEEVNENGEVVIEESTGEDSAEETSEETVIDNI